MPTNKTYEIDSFEKLVNTINKENFESLTSDLMLWLWYMVEGVEQLRATLPSKYKNKSNWDLCKMTFVWTDDGKNELTGLTVKDPKTGEIYNVKFKGKKL